MKSPRLITNLFAGRLDQAKLIRLSERLYRTLIESAPDGILITGRSGLIEQVNARAESMFGYSAHELEGRPVEVLLPGNLRDSHGELRRDYHAHPRVRGMGVGQSLVALRKDGAEFPVEISLSPFQLEGESFVVAVIRDVTERKEIEGRLRSAEEKLAMVANNVNDIFYAVSFDGDPLAGKLEIVSQQVERVTGYHPEEFLTNPALWFSLLNPEDIPTVSATTQTLVSEKRMVTRLYRLRHKETGEDRWFEDRASPRIDRHGNVTGIIGVARDVTEMRRVEEQLRLKTEQLQTITDAMGAYLEKGDWQEANRRLLNAALRQSQSEYAFAGAMYGSVLRILVSEGVVWSETANRAFYEDAMRRYAETGYLEFKNFDNLFGHVVMTGKAVLSNDCPHDPRSGGVPEGHPALNSFLGVPILRKGHVVGMIGVANRPGGYGPAEQEHLEVLAQAAGVLFDSYRRLQHEESLEAQLRQAQKMEAIGRLAGGVAHDFNNLLTVIKGYSQMMAGAALPEELVQPLNEIQKAADRAVGLTRQLLTFSRRQVLQPRVFDLNGLIKAMQPMIQRLIGEDIELKSICEPEPATIKADPGQIEQVLMNLVINARDAMPGGGQLTTKTSRLQLSGEEAAGHPGLSPGLFILMSVTDTGCGMDSSVTARIFEPFFTTKELGKGTGLGLSTAYGIVRQSGGSIEVRSKVGAGAAFNIYLPWSLEAPGEEPVVRTGPSIAATETILLVEDDEMVRQLTTAALRQTGYQVLAASNGAEAAKYCTEFKEPIHLVLTDVVMPGADGPQTAAQLKSIRPGLKTLFMSGYVGDVIARHGLRESEISILEKPFTPDALRKKVREVLQSAPETIVVADDDESIREFMRNGLEWAGFRVSVAADGEEALRLVREAPRLLLITDLVMPRKDGLDLSVEVQRAFPALPIIAVSTAAGLKAIRFATELQNIALLEKPFSLKELLVYVGRILSSS